MVNIYKELSQLQKFAQIGKQFNNTDLNHLDAPMGAYNYIRMADFIAQHMGKNGEFLDWGAGYGQMTWLLRNRGLNTSGYNIEERQHVDAMSELAKLPMIYGNDPVKLPFQNSSFAGVCSCGVLEHVQDPSGSLQEIHRILCSGGYFYLFMFPQKTACVEKLSEMRGISVHPVKYTMAQTHELLTQNGFKVEKLWRFNLIPKNLTGVPHHLKRIYGRLYRFLYPLDNVLSKIPLLNLLSGVIEGVARKI